MDDTDLARIFYGDDAGAAEAALTELYSRHFQDLVAFLAGKFRLRYQDAEDYAEAAFLKLAVTRETGKGRFDLSKQARFASWLYTVARNLVVSGLRRPKVLAGFQGEDVNPLEAAPSEEEVQRRKQAGHLDGPRQVMWNPPEEPPDEGVGQGELADLIQRGMQTLSERHRLVLQRTIEGKDLLEIAAELSTLEGRQIPKGTIGRLRSEARQALKDYLKAGGWDLA